MAKYQVGVRPSSKLPEALKHSEGIRQALHAVTEHFPYELVLDEQELVLLGDTSKALRRYLIPGAKVDVALQFVDLCSISSDIFKELKDIRKTIKDIISDHEDALESDHVGALRYVKDFRAEMGPALAASITLRRFANYADAVLLAQIQYSAENVEIELFLREVE